jgi:hypothetical protein
MKRNCLSCRWGYKCPSGIKCAFPVPYYMRVKMEPQVPSIIIEYMDCDVWDLKMTEEARRKQCLDG